MIAAMDIFTLPSLDEGIPMALLEAMALSRPVVATPVGGVPEIVTDGSTGLLVPVRNEQMLAARCLDLARDREWAGTLGENARQFVEREFSIVAERQDLDIRHFSSIAALVAFVEAKLSVAADAEPRRGHPAD